MGTITPDVGNTATFYATIGDANAVISTRLRDDSGLKDLTGATVTFNAWKKSDNTITISGTATVDADQTANKGLVAYTLTSANLDGSPETAGEYECEWKVVLGGATVRFPAPGKDTLFIQDKTG
jgi:hypothetical protein